MKPGARHLLDLLCRDGIVLTEAAQAIPLAGGISSDIYLVSDGVREFVVKRALDKLKVADEWRSDPIRNRYEQRYLRYVGSFLPDAVPRVLFGSEENGYFGMEYLRLATWKAELLQGVCDGPRARQAMSLLAQIHRRSRDQAKLAQEFNTTDNFHQLRTDPYLLTIARRHPGLASMITKEAARLESTHECLVHGDFSPKNILVGTDRMVLLDCEVAWYGDPAFDVAFLLNHLCLKALHHAPQQPGFKGLFETAVTTYFGMIEVRAVEDATALDRRSARLLLMLMLARVDGKSPAEYLDAEEKRNFVREFVDTVLPNFGGSLNEVGHLWFTQLAKRFGSS